MLPWSWSLEHVLVGGVNDQLVGPTGVLPEQLEKFPIGWGSSPAASASSFSVVGDGNQGERGVLGGATSLGRGPPTDFLVEFHPALFGKEGVVLIVARLERGGR